MIFALKQVKFFWKLLKSYRATEAMWSRATSVTDQQRESRRALTRMPDSSMLEHILNWSIKVDSFSKGWKLSSLDGLCWPRNWPKTTASRIQISWLRNAIHQSVQRSARLSTLKARNCMSGASLGDPLGCWHRPTYYPRIRCNLPSNTNHTFWDKFKSPEEPF